MTTSPFTVNLSALLTQTNSQSTHTKSTTHLHKLIRICRTRLTSPMMVNGTIGDTYCGSLCYAFVTCAVHRRRTCTSSRPLLYACDDSTSTTPSTHCRTSNGYRSTYYATRRTRTRCSSSTLPDSILLKSTQTTGTHANMRASDTHARTENIIDKSKQRLAAVSNGLNNFLDNHTISNMKKECLDLLFGRKRRIPE